MPCFPERRQIEIVQDTMRWLPGERHERTFRLTPRYSTRLPWPGAAMTSEDLFVLFGVAFTTVFLAVVIVAVIAGWCRSLRNWWRGVEPPEPTWSCIECEEREVPDPFDTCSECKRKEQTPSEPRWAHLLNRDDVMVLDVSTFGSLDNQAEVTDAAVIDTHGNVLLTDLWARAVRALPPNRMLATPRYHDVLGPLMRVLKRASIICVYNAEFDIPLIKGSVARHGRDETLDAEIICIKDEYASRYTSDGTWLKLEETARRESVLNEVGKPHPPLNDVRLTLGIMCKVVARECRARGLPVGDALAPNYSGVSSADDIPEKTESRRIQHDQPAPDPAGRPIDRHALRSLPPHTTKCSTPAALNSVDDDEVLRDLARRRGLKPGQNWHRQ